MFRPVRAHTLRTTSRHAAKRRLPLKFRPRIFRLEDRLLLNGTPVGGELYALGRSISDNGQSIVFGNGQPEPPGTFVLSGVFVRNVQTGAATRVDLTPAGAPGDGISYPGIISGDGR